jgi:hypothetical protein
MAKKKILNCSNGVYRLAEGEIKTKSGACTYTDSVTAVEKLDSSNEEAA